LCCCARHVDYVFRANSGTVLSILPLVVVVRFDRPGESTAMLSLTMHQIDTGPLEHSASIRNDRRRPEAWLNCRRKRAPFSAMAASRSSSSLERPGCKLQGPDPNLCAEVYELVDLSAIPLRTPMGLNGPLLPTLDARHALTCLPLARLNIVILYTMDMRRQFICCVEHAPTIRI
jgi:hypothetical protein